MNTNTARITPEHNLFSEVERTMDDIKTDLMSTELLSADHRDVERLIETKTRGLMRELFQAHLDLRAAKEQKVTVRGADNIARTAARESTRKLETLFGEVTVTRQLYQAPGTDGLAPMDAALNPASGTVLLRDPAIRGGGGGARIVR